VCTWVSLVLPRDADREAIAKLSNEYAVARGFLNDEQVRWRGHDVVSLDPRSTCFCGTAVGSAGPRPSSASGIDHAYEQRLIKDLEKKGWGKTKVRRYLEEVRKTTRRDQRVYEQNRALADEHVEQAWIPFLREVVGRGYAWRVGIVATWGQADATALKEAKTVSARELEPSRIEQLDEDEVLTVTS
jgi:hypothetical protein